MSRIRDNHGRVLAPPSEGQQLRGLYGGGYGWVERTNHQLTIIDGDISKTSDATNYTTISGLYVNLVNEAPSISFDAVLKISGANFGGFDIKVIITYTGTGGVTINNVSFLRINSLSSLLQVATFYAIAVSAADYRLFDTVFGDAFTVMHIKGAVMLNKTYPFVFNSIELQFRQSTSNATPSIIEAGSHVSWHI